MVSAKQFLNNTANKQVFKILGLFLLYGMAPLLVGGFLFSEAIISGLIDQQGYYLLCLFLIGVFKAISDTLADHYEDSVFKSFNRIFWDKSISWRNKYKMYDPRSGRKKFLWIIPIPVMFTDGWHLSNSFAIASIVTSVHCFVPFDIPLWKQILLSVGSIHYGFHIFYNLILVRK